jgi:hypothetical protein
MTKSRPPTLRGHDTLLHEQALEMANLRAARDDRRAMEGHRTPKWYRLGSPNPEGTWTIDVADRGADNWRQRETCATLQLAQERVQQLTVDDTEFFRESLRQTATADVSRTALGKRAADSEVGRGDGGHTGGRTRKRRSWRDRLPPRTTTR